MKKRENEITCEKFIADLAEKFRIEKEIKKQLSGKYDYIEWLYNFTKTFSYFSDIDWLYQIPRAVTDEDYKNVKMLTLFFEVVSEYFQDNLLPANGTTNNAWYTIKYKDVYLDIGVCVGQGAYNYVESHEEKPNRYVEFEKILANKSDSALKIKQERLLTLEHLLLEMYNLNIPRSEVIKKVQMVFK